MCANYEEKMRLNSNVRLVEILPFDLLKKNIWSCKAASDQIFNNHEVMLEYLFDGDILTFLYTNCLLKAHKVRLMAQDDAFPCGAGWQVSQM